MNSDVGNFRKKHIGRHIYELDHAFKSITIPYVQQHGFPEFTGGQLKILGNINMHKPTPTQDLINKLNVSKQAVSRMIAQCEKNGFIKRQVSLTDSRSKDIIFSEKGINLMKVAAKATNHAENELKNKIGADKFKELKNILESVSFELDLINID